MDPESALSSRISVARRQAWPAYPMPTTVPRRSRRRPPRGRSLSWLVTTLFVTCALVGAVGWRWVRSSDQAVVTVPAEVESLPRTRKLVAQKAASLESYNQAISVEELIAFLGRHVEGELSPDAFAALSDYVTRTLVPSIWQECQETDERAVSQATMAKVLAKHYPRQVLANADVIFLPNDRELRTVVAEAPQDHFRDSGWHWRWIGQSMETFTTGSGTQWRELETYAAEELSEFLSVYAVALVEIVARDERQSGHPIRGEQLVAVATQIDALGAMIPHRNPVIDTPLVGYSEEAKRALVETLPRPMFHDISRQVQLDFAHRPKTVFHLIRYDLEVPMGVAGGGVAAGDFDADGWIDLYFAGDNGGRLFRNLRGERCEDASFTAGLTAKGESRAGYFVDYDNDGDLDLFITFVGESNRLYENDGSGHYEDITERVGLLGDNSITHEAAWFDMDRDGLLDLYTATFGDWLNGAIPTIGRSNANAGPNRLYRHRVVDGRHVFEEVGEEMGVDDRGWTHCAGVWDYDDDGYPDIFSLNDFGASLLYRNVEGKRFEEASRNTHLDACYNAMNFTLMDLAHDGRPSLYITQVMKLTHRQRYRKPGEDTPVIFTAENLENLRPLVLNLLYSPRDDGTFQDIHDSTLEPTNMGWAWGANAVDYENDGDLELYVLNGTESKIPMHRATGKKADDAYLAARAWLEVYRDQPNVFFASADDYFYNVSPLSGLDFTGNSRAATFFDFDNDGDLDVAVNSFSAPARLFENRQESNNNWIRLTLEGSQSNRDAIGATVELRFGDERRFETVVSRSSFLSQDVRILHFGLGKADQVDEVHIRWPSGATQQLQDLTVNKQHHIVEGR